MYRIVAMGTYPITSPIHGGQIRAGEILKTLRGAGCAVEYLCVFDSNGYPGEAPGFWMRPFTQDFLIDLARRGLRPDVYAADYLLGGAEMPDILEGICTFLPDVLWLEQPWMWPVARAILAEARQRGLPVPRVVYSSQNNEVRLMERMLAMASSSSADDVIARTREIELGLLAEADLTLAVSEADAADFRPLCRRVAVVANGTSPKGLPGGWDYWSSRYAHARTALFVGSAHPPNAAGLVSMLGPSLGFLPPDRKVLVVGGVCGIMDAVPEFRPNRGRMLARMELLGVQNSGGLDSLFRLADVILLPITEGGGTNIKTAEALVSGKPILATPLAFRGYEAFLTNPRVSIRATAAGFKARLAELLGEPRAEHPGRVPDDAASLLWFRTLESLPFLVRSLFPAEELPLGCTDFAVGDGFARVLAQGWNRADSWGVWSKEHDATVRFRIPDGIGFPVRARIAFNVLVPRNGATVMTIKANGRPVFRATLTEDHTTKFADFQLDEDDFDEFRSVALAFDSSEISIPALNGPSADHRLIGFGLHSFQVLVEPRGAAREQARAPEKRAARKPRAEALR